MKNPPDEEDFFTALKKKRDDVSLPPGFDERFWKKFDKSYPSKSKMPTFFALGRVGIPAVALLLVFVLWNRNPYESTAFRDEDVIIVDPEVGAEDLDIAQHLDLLDSVDDEVWNNFL